jgi:hypothetical protein
MLPNRFPSAALFGVTFPISQMPHPFLPVARSLTRVLQNSSVAADSPAALFVHK